MSACPPTALGQLFLLALEDGKWSRNLERQLRSLQPAGVVVPVRSLHSLDAANRLLGKICGALASPPFLGAAGEDLEAYPLGALSPSLSRLPFPAEVAEKGPGAAEMLGRLRGALLRRLGFNVDFGFALDLAPRDCKGRSGFGTFGSDPELVAECGEAYLRGLRRFRILACAKHFPGLGSAQPDPRTRSLVSANTMVGLWREDLVPFRRLLARLPLVMISPAVYKAYDFEVARPAVFSDRVVDGLLRTKLGYRGIAVADLPQLEYGGVKHELRDAALSSLRAGCDLIIVREDADSVEGMIQAVKNALDWGGLSAERLRESLARIAARKRGLAVPRRPASGGATQELIRQLKEWLKDFEG